MAGIRELLKGGSPSFRRAVISLALHEDLDRARTAYLRVYEAGEAYKADLIRRNGASLKAAAERLDEVLKVLVPVAEVAVLAVRAAGVADDRLAAVHACMSQLGAICGPWRDVRPGMERGAGLPGYDDADACAAAREEAVQLHERWVAQAKKSA